MPRLSVIIPVYNVEDYIAKCLDSVLAVGAETDYEIIVVNDGSTDRSPLIAAEYAERLPELVRLVSTENLGQGHARNVGIELARGEYILFLDSDDYLAENAMRDIMSTLGMDYDICIFDSIAVSPGGREIKYMHGAARSEGLSLGQYPELLLEGPDVWNKVIRRSLFTDNDLSFTSRVWFEDLRTIPKLYLFTDRIIYIPQPWHRYLQRPTSVTHTVNVERNLEIIPAVDELTEFYRRHERYDELRDVLEYLAFHSQFLTSSVRANLQLWNTPVQDELIGNFLGKHPDFRQNPYVRRMSRSHKLLTYLLLRRRYMAVHILMKLNDTIKRKYA